MSSENWKILLDYKSEHNVTKHSLNGACVLLFWEEKLLHVSLWQSTAASTSKLYSYNTSIGNPKVNVSDARRRLFPDLLRTQNMVPVIDGKISIGNSMICSDIWHKYHECTSDISKLLYVISRAVRRVKFETILKYHKWYLGQISRTNHAISCLYYYPQKVCNFHM